MKELAVQIIEDADTLAVLETGWWELWRRAPSATPFQSPAWLLPWWSSFSPGELFVVACRHAERLVGLAPFYIESGVQGRRILPIGISLSDYLDVLIDPQWEGPVAHAVVNEIARQRARWDSWALEELRPEAAALALACPDACCEKIEQQSACPVLRLAAGNAFCDVPQGKLRKLRMTRNRLSRLDAQIFVPPQECWREFIAGLFRLHATRWESSGETGVLKDCRVHAFHLRSVPRLLSAGLLRLYGISIQDRLAGAYYGFTDRRLAYAYLTGFDPVFAYGSPGTALVGHAIDEAAREGCREFHFLRGQEDYKYSWGASDRWNCRRSFRPAGPALP